MKIYAWLSKEKVEANDLYGGLIMTLFGTSDFIFLGKRK
jgi:hypothetical protein